MKKRIALLLALIMCLSLVACGGNNKADNKGNNIATEEKKDQVQDIQEANKDQQAQAKPEETVTYKKALTISSSGEISSIDPHTNSAGGNDKITKMYANQLINFNWETKEIEPELAESWTVEDADSYLFNLRKGVKFSNGEEFTADDVVFTYIERFDAVGGTTNTKLRNAIQEIEVIDDYTIRIKLVSKNADFLHNLYPANTGIMNREACEADATEGHFIGTGGWIIDEWAANDFVKFVKYNDSWVWAELGETPTEEITMKCITEGSARTIALQNKEIAVSDAVASADLPSLESDDTVETLTFAQENLYYAFFNMASGVFAEDVNLRKAVAFAMNYEDINAYMTKGLGQVATTMWGLNQFGYFDDFEEKPEYNVDKAKEYLAQSGMPNGGTIELLCVTSFEKMATLIQAQLKEIGLEVTVSTTDTAGVNAAVKENNFEMALFNITQRTDGDRFAWIPDISSSTNRAHYDNPEMLQKMKDALTTADEATRLQLYKEIQIELNEDKPYVPLYIPTGTVGWNEGVSGVIWSPDTKHDFVSIRWAE